MGVIDEGVCNLSDEDWSYVLRRMHRILATRIRGKEVNSSPGQLPRPKTNSSPGQPPRKRSHIVRIELDGEKFVTRNSAEAYALTVRMLAKKYGCDPLVEDEINCKSEANAHRPYRIPNTTIVVDLNRSTLHTIAAIKRIANLYGVVVRCFTS